MWTYILGPVLALLPARWRAMWFGRAPVSWARATMVSGFVEAVGCALALAAWYLTKIQELVNQQTAVAVDALGKAKDLQGLTNIELAYSMGLGGLFTFLANPLTWLLVFCTVEGVWRAFAATLNDESPGTGILGVFDWMIVRRQKRAYEARVPLVEDRVTRAAEGVSNQDWSLKIETCRPKPSWSGPQIIRIKDEYFRVQRETIDDQAQYRGDGQPVRPHTYFLKRVPAGEAYLGCEDYHPRDVLKPAGPGLGAIALGALKDGMKIKVTPLVADSVRRDMEGPDVFLHIESCRPKEGWTIGRTLKYEDCFYRIEKSYETQGPRPWGHTLRLLSMGVMGRSVILYDPNEILIQAARDRET